VTDIDAVRAGGAAGDAWKGFTEFLDENLVAVDENLAAVAP
jgi:hypothetical protein